MMDLYKEISEEILKILSYSNIDEDEIEKKLDKRQALIDSLNEKELKNFILAYREELIYEVDKKIKYKLEEAILNVKKQIREHKTQKVVNKAYIKNGKNNLNLFTKKV